METNTNNPAAHLPPRESPVRLSEPELRALSSNNTAGIVGPTILFLSLFVLVTAFCYFGIRFCQKWRKQVEGQHEPEHGREQQVEEEDEEEENLVRVAKFESLETAANSMRPREREEEEEKQEIEFIECEECQAHTDDEIPVLAGARATKDDSLCSLREISGLMDNAKEEDKRLSGEVVGFVPLEESLEPTSVEQPLPEDSADLMEPKNDCDGSFSSMSDIENQKPSATSGSERNAPEKLDESRADRWACSRFGSISSSQ